MSVEIQTTVTNGVTVIACSGQITLGLGSNQFRTVLRELLQQGARAIVVDFSQVSYLDSTGIGELVGAYTAAHNASASVKLAAVPEKILELLEITKLNTVFDIYPDRASAVAAFA
ncbi:MAG: STAS domain-containing protein [Acidobacteria bacterium]|nr:STAS domain-containing protein [Acidobacteriota bacterium]